MYQIEVVKSALKELESIPKIFKSKIISKIDDLAAEPRPGGVKKLEGSINTYRIGVGNYRIIYQIKDLQLIITVIKISDRKDAYK
ncbi:type II toxin-antitoxin system RelE family toxin [Dyadobacter frigoris]|nr:hypothetical protein Dfri01_58130 [Dyadobacter frigoris]